MAINNKLKAKINALPLAPGVYFYKDQYGQIIYIGKASKLKNRVKQYFVNNKYKDPKTVALVREIADLEVMELDSEASALFMEAEMIRRYLPKYNILLRDDKALAYIRIDYDSNYPTVSYTRRPLDDGARYFGPYNSLTSVKLALKYLRRVFPYATSRHINQKRVSLEYHLGLDPGLEEGRTSLTDYRRNLRRLMAIISGEQVKIVADLNKEMHQAAKENNFELAAIRRDQLTNLKRLTQQIIFSNSENLDLAKDNALADLVELFNLNDYPRRIEGYDISHMSGTDVVASMVTFINGVPSKVDYRKFKTKQDINNDFYNMNETIARRFSQRNLQRFGWPDLVLIDGGKGQLTAALEARQQANLTRQVPFIGLAKRFEQIVVEVKLSYINLNLDKLHKLGGNIQENDNFITLNLPLSSHLIKLLQRVRDESHRFAVSYHSSLKLKRVRKSRLDEISGIGPKTKKSLMTHFGSVKNLTEASETELASIVGNHKAKLIKRSL